MTEWSPVDEPLPGHRRRTDGPSVVLLHGFTQTGLSWTSVADELDRSFDLFAPDAPGHGRSSQRRVGLAEYAGLLAASLPPSTYVGYSMGGRTALRLALDHPDRVRALVLIGATPGIDDPDERAARRDADEGLARRILAASLDDFLNDWLAQDLFATLPPSAWNLEDRRRNDAEGLASSLRLAGTGTQESLWSRLHEITCPTILVTGRRDEKFTRVAERMATTIGGPVEHVNIDGHGHAVHLECPDRVASLVNRVVSRLG
jgi:2-succinyl-6-hydroxy-2,4-cyclohexadiene-1-carboxylate synthase